MSKNIKIIKFQKMFKNVGKHVGDMFWTNFGKVEKCRGKVEKTVDRSIRRVFSFGGNVLEHLLFLKKRAFLFDVFLDMFSASF